MGKVKERTEGALASLGLLVLRLAAGGMLATHGWAKLEDWSTMSAAFPDPLGVGTEVSLALAIFGELVCGIAVALGLLTRLTAVPAAVTMAVAALVVHGPDPMQKKELPLLYLACFVTLILAGPGSLAVDRLLRRRRSHDAGD